MQEGEILVETFRLYLYLFGKSVKRICDAWTAVTLKILDTDLQVLHNLQQLNQNNLFSR